LRKIKLEIVLANVSEIIGNNKAKTLPVKDF